MSVRRTFRAMGLILCLSVLTTAGLVAGGSVPAGAPTFTIIIQVAGHKGFPNGTVGKAYTAHLNARGGESPIHWKIASGKLPTGLKLGPATGTISGKPTKKGRYAFTVQATDSAKPPHTAKLAGAITVK
jgi:Putative Ig domain